MRTRGMHHISLKVAEDCYPATVGFYRDLLELKVVRIQDTATFLSSGNVTIEILKSDKVQAEKGAVDHIAFLVDDVDSLLNTLRKAGFRVTMEPTKHTFTGEVPYCVYIAFVVGPAGESIELLKEL